MRSRLSRENPGGTTMNKFMRIAIGAPALLAASMFWAAAQAYSLMLYTSQPDADAAKTVEAFSKVNPDIEVQVYRSGTS